MRGPCAVFQELRRLRWCRLAPPWLTLVAPVASPAALRRMRAPGWSASWTLRAACAPARRIGGRSKRCALVANIERRVWVMAGGLG